MTFSRNDALKVTPGKLYQLRGTHMIKKNVPQYFNVLLGLHKFGSSIEIVEGDCIFVIGLAPSPYNQDELGLQYSPDYPCIHVWFQGQDFVIKQSNLLCGLYHEVE